MIKRFKLYYQKDYAVSFVETFEVTSEKYIAFFFLK